MSHFLIPMLFYRQIKSQAGLNKNRKTKIHLSQFEKEELIMKKFKEFLSEYYYSFAKGYHM